MIVEVVVVGPCSSRQKSCAKAGEGRVVEAVAGDAEYAPVISLPRSDLGLRCRQKELQLVHPTSWNLGVDRYGQQSVRRMTIYCGARRVLAAVSTEIVTGTGTAVRRGPSPQTHFPEVLATGAIERKMTLEER